MIDIRKSQERGRTKEEWLDSRHTFSFHTYHDPEQMGFRDLRVINEDQVAGGRGFAMHPHRDMEIVSLVLSGALEHRDDLGHREVIGPYELQRITAGRGIRHSETNPRSEEVHFLQIWILPEAEGLDPGYEIRRFADRPPNRLIALAAPDGRENAAVLRQDAVLYYARLEEGRVDFSPGEGRYGWVQIIEGEATCNGRRLEAGDGAAIRAERELSLAASGRAELLLFDLA